MISRMIIGRGQGIRSTWVKRQGDVENGLAVMTISYFGRDFGLSLFCFVKRNLHVFVFRFGEHEDIGWAKRVGDLLWNVKKIDDLILDIIE